MKRHFRRTDNNENDLGFEHVSAVRDVARRATTTTEQLCQLYVTVTQTMDPSLVKYYLHNEKVQKLFKRSYSSES